eukprot:56581-Eustigmatos_ZCMA.PRE.1
MVSAKLRTSSTCATCIVRAEEHEVLVGVEGGDLDAAAADEEDDGARDEVDHGDCEARVEPGPEVQEPLRGVQTLLQ